MSNPFAVPIHAGTILVVLFAWIASPVAIAPAFAQEPGSQLSDEEEITIPKQGAAPRIRILLEAFLPEPGATPGDTRAVHDVLANDLNLSDFFIVTNIPRMSEGDSLTATQSKALVRGAVSLVGGELVLRGTLESLPGRSTILSKEYRVAPERYREAAHAYADDIVLYLTGEQGIAGTRIAFVGKSSGNKELYVVDYDGHGRRRLTNNGSINLAPAWSPDGTRIAFVSYQNGDPDIYLLEVNTGTQTLLVGGLGVQAAPAFSPDGRLVAFSHTAGRESEIYVCNAADGGNLRRVTRVGGINTSPSWSPNGRRLVFTSDRSGNPQLYTVDMEGGSAKRLTFQGKWNDIPDWSPKGNRVAFCSRSNGQFRICLVDPSGLGEEEFQTFGPGSDEHPRFSPNGRHLIYASQRGGVRGLYVLDTESRTNRILLSGGGDYSSPAWSPAGRR